MEELNEKIAHYESKIRILETQIEKPIIEWSPEETEVYGDKNQLRQLILEEKKGLSDLRQLFIIEEKKALLEKENKESVGYLLDILMMTCAAENKFKPTPCQVKQLRGWMIDPVRKNALTWINFIDKNLLTKLFFDDVNKHTEQMERANSIINCLQKNNKTSVIYYMDGHGRFTFCLLKKLFENKILSSDTNPLKLVVVEKDPTVHEWHKKFFPELIYTSWIDIYNLKPEENPFFYFNFCNIDGTAGIENLFKFTTINESKQKTKPKYCSFLLSFSKRGFKKVDKPGPNKENAISEEYDLNKDAKKASNTAAYKLLTDTFGGVYTFEYIISNGNFLTYIANSSENHVTGLENPMKQFNITDPNEAEINV